MDQFLKKFKYEAGSILDGPRDVRKSLTGDCSDFAWSLLLLIEGSPLKALLALATLKASLWRVKSPSNGIIPRHVALWHRDYGWIDSTVRKWRSEVSPHKKAWLMLPPVTALAVLWANLVGKHLS